MARLVQKSSFTKSSSAKGYMKYIASRKGVEVIDGNEAVTKKQKQFIDSLLKSNPGLTELHEYEDYLSNQTVANANELISVARDFSSPESPNLRKYLKYIATRPGVEKHGSHGLFSDAESVDLKAALHSLESFEGNVWTLIYSLRREDAERLGFDSANRWRSLICSHQPEFAEALHVAPNRLRWYAAFHNEGHHPHIHMMIWSEDNDGFLSKKGIEKMRSFMTNDIFEMDLHELYVLKDFDYHQLRDTAYDQMKNALSRMESGVYTNPMMAEKMIAFMTALDKCNGKKQYGYLPKSVKAIVDDIVDELSKNEEVAKCYAAWCSLQEAVEHYYHGREIVRLPLSKRKEFRAIKNMIISEAAAMNQQRFKNEANNEHSENGPSAYDSSQIYYTPLYSSASVQSDLQLKLAAASAVASLLKHMAIVFRSNALPPSNPKGLRVDSRRRKKLRKHLAYGHKQDDQEETISQTMR